jgi:hypothetical protein
VGKKEGEKGIEQKSEVGMRKSEKGIRKAEIFDCGIGLL